LILNIGIKPLDRKHFRDFVSLATFWIWNCC